jgi:hypothetical protein
MPPQGERDAAPVRGEPRSPALGLEIPFIPERDLALHLGRLQRMGDILDQVAVDADEPGAALGPERGTDAGRAAAPVIAREHRARNRQRIHQINQIRPDRRLLARTHGRGIEESGRSIAPQIGHDDAAALRGKDGRHVDVRVDVVGKAVQQHRDRSIGRPGLVIGDVEHAGIDVTERLEALRGRRTWRHDCNSRTVLTRC